jgi:hypothetical protein
MWTQLISHFEDLVNSWIGNVGLMYFFFSPLKFDNSIVSFSVLARIQIVWKGRRAHKFRSIFSPRDLRTLMKHCRVPLFYQQYPCERERKNSLNLIFVLPYALVLTVYLWDDFRLWLLFKVFFYLKIY